MNIYKIRVESFEPYGLNKYKNFLEENELQAYSEDEVVGWAEGILIGNDIEETMAIFIQAANGNMYAITKEYDWEEEYYYIERYLCCDNFDFLAMLDAELNFSSYGLIMQTGKTVWKIIAF